MAQINNGTSKKVVLRPNDWWTNDAMNGQRSAESRLPISLHDLLFLALRNSEQIKVYSEVPLIRETAIAEADSSFDWTKFADGLWEYTDEPVGNTLTVGGGRTRHEDHNLSFSGGIRRRTWSGGQVELSQRVGHQNSNSTFFLPNNQGTTRLALGFTQPLMRGRGRINNQSLTVLAGIDRDTANLEFSRQLQSHLLEIARGYWALYLERAILAQRVKLFLQTQEIAQKLKVRQGVDSSFVQISSVNAALENRRADLIRAQAAVKNAETRLRSLVNAPELGQADNTELIPTEPPTFDRFQADFLAEVETAIQNRPEIEAAMKEIKSASVRLNMAKHELLPALNLVTNTYLSGLRGNSDIGRAWKDQFSGTPSYSFGLQYEMPMGIVPQMQGVAVDKLKFDNFAANTKIRYRLFRLKLKLLSANCILRIAS